MSSGEDENKQVKDSNDQKDQNKQTECTARPFVASSFTTSSLVLRVHHDQCDAVLVSVKSLQLAFK